MGVIHVLFQCTQSRSEREARLETGTLLNTINSLISISSHNQSHKDLRNLTFDDDDDDDDDDDKSFVISQVLQVSLYLWSSELKNMLP